jgi:hypothetical protein
MTTSIPPSPSPSPSSPPPIDDRLPLRLHLLEPSARAAVDGSWWPQSRDLTVELPDLVDHFPQERGRVDRAVFSRPDWDAAPHRVRVARGVLHVGSYPHDDTHQVWLSMSSRKLIRLSVHAPDEAIPDATTPPQPPRSSATADERDHEGEDHWSDDGGSWAAPHRVAPSHRI